MVAKLGPMDDMELAQQESEWSGDEVSGYGSEGPGDSFDAEADVCDDGEYGSAWEACMNDLFGSVDEDVSRDFESEHVSNEYGSEWSDAGSDASGAGSEGTFDSDSDLELAQHL